MSDSEKDLAVQIVYSANRQVSELMLRQAEERLRALQVAAHALDQRVTQVAAFQLAAAAVVAGLTVAKHGSLFVGSAALAFLVGGVVAFRGVRSDEIHLPGIAPIWWKGTLEHERFSADNARAWIAGAYQTAITKTDEENCARARHLNLSLRYAIGGATLMACAAFLRIFS